MKTVRNWYHSELVTALLIALCVGVYYWAVVRAFS